MLLSSAIGEGVRYAVLQDQDGLLAASPAPPVLSTSAQYPELPAVDRDQDMRFYPLTGSPPLL